MTPPNTYYDYDNQAWIVNGKYAPCAHPADVDCKCYSRAHAGQPATPMAQLDNELEQATLKLNNAKNHLTALRNQIYTRGQLRQGIINNPDITIEQKFEQLLESCDEI